MTRHLAPTTQPTSHVAKIADAVSAGAECAGAECAAVSAGAAPLSQSFPGAHWDTIAGERIAFLPQRAAWWERARTLILADLHLGKAEAFAAAGAGLNGGVLDETLARISHCALALNASRLIIVGDLLHAPAGLTLGLIDRVREWRRTLTAQIVVVPGNHDRRIETVAREWDLLVTGSSLVEPPFGFIHDPVDIPPPPALPDARAWWVGHVHPCVWLGGRADALKLPCFIVSDRAIQLPAFSTFTSGVCVRTAPGERVHVIADSTVLPLNR